MKASSRHRRIPTNNAMGWSSNTLNELSELFVQDCSGHKGRVLDIGAALGIASLAALEAGARVVANDTDAEHLRQIEAQARPELLERLELRPGRFPRRLPLEEEGFDAVHASNIFHFLTGRQLEVGAQSLRHALKPGGKLFAIAATPYMSPFQDFVGPYEARKDAGELWPGWVENIRSISKHRLLSRLPKSIHLLDGTVLERVFAAAGFDVERCWLFRRRDLPKSLHFDGRESVGLIARRI